MPLDALSNLWTIPVLDAAPGDCRWPEDMDSDYSGNWSVTTHFCGRPAVSDKPYCQQHCERAYSKNYDAVKIKFVKGRRC